MPFNLKNTDTSPIHTSLVDSVVAGANLAQASSFPLKISDTVFIPKNLQSLCRLFMTKSSKGVVSLHQLVPVMRIGHRITGENRKPQISRSLYFIAISCNKNEFDSNDNVHVFKDSTLAMVERAFEPSAPFNGIAYNGSPSNGYIPRSVDAWNKLSGQEKKVRNQTTGELQGTGEFYTLGEIANQQVLAKFKAIKKNVDLLDNSTTNETVSQKLELQIAKDWEEYQNFTQTYIQSGILVESDFAYVDPSSLRPIITCFQDTSSATQKYLSAQFMYGSLEAAASYAPETSMVVGVGIVTPTLAEPVSGYQYGQFAVNSRRGQVTTVDEANKKTTLETCTRELAVFDESGRPAVIQMTINDIDRGGEPIKRSTNFANVAVGTTVMVSGKLQIRSKGVKGSYAVNFRITEPNWTSLNSAASNAVNADLTFEQVDETLDFENVMTDLQIDNEAQNNVDAQQEDELLDQTFNPTDLNAHQDVENDGQIPVPVQGDDKDKDLPF